MSNKELQTKLISLNSRVDEIVQRYRLRFIDWAEVSIEIALIFREAKKGIAKGKYEIWEAEALKRNELTERMLRQCKRILNHADEARRLTATRQFDSLTDLIKALPAPQRKIIMQPIKTQVDLTRSSEDRVRSTTAQNKLPQPVQTKIDDEVDNLR